MTPKTLLAFLSLTILPLPFTQRACADVTLPAIFSEHMVLQRDAVVPVWGWADAGESITVSIAGQTKKALTGKDGKWRVNLDKLKAGEPTTFTVRGKNTITVQDVLIGEVWLGSGQSNMAMLVRHAKDAVAETAAANFPGIRMFHETSGPSLTPQEKGKGEWRVCNPQNVGDFSATAYFFGREIHKVTGANVGLIDSSVGATPIEAWTSLPVLKALPETKPLFERWAKLEANWDSKKAKADYQTALAKWEAASEKAKTEGKKAPFHPFPPMPPSTSVFHPGNLFNGKIIPLIPYAIRGAIWYQGESNTTPDAAQIYGLQLATMVKDWRAHWGEGDFPFAWVQLPNFLKPQSEPVEESGWPVVREEMLKTLSLPNTGMAITIDIGEEADIHPHNKQEVGRRLALWALAKVYGQKNTSSGPLPNGHKISGGNVTVSFQHTDGGLIAKEGELKGFALAGADKKWVKADAKIEGDKVVVSSPDVKEPVALRYAWANNPDCNLYNGAGIPASPFRTDNWEFVPPPAPPQK